MKKILTLVIVAGIACAGSGLAQTHKPSDLRYPPLRYNPPDPKAFRVDLANGLPLIKNALVRYALGAL